MKDLTQDVAHQVGLEPQKVREVITQAFIHIHRGFYERRSPGYGGYVGGPLLIDIGSEAYYHFIGMLICLDEDYVHDEPQEWSEYVSRAIPIEEINIYREQLTTWVRESHE